jgi:hypothetical protein
MNRTSVRRDAIAVGWLLKNLFMMMMTTMVTMMIMCASVLPAQSLTSSAPQAHNVLLDSAALMQQREYTSLDEALKEPLNVVRLNLSFNGLSDVPADIARCKNLQSLNLSNNGLAELPESIAHLEMLQYLSVSTNGLKKLPQALQKLKHLKTLDVSQNQIPFSELERVKKALTTVRVVD